MSISQDQNLRWSLDFVHGHPGQRLALPYPDLGRRLHPGMLGLVVDTSLTALRVVREPDQVIESRGAPA
jgi:putative transposase